MFKNKKFNHLKNSITRSFDSFSCHSPPLEPKKVSAVYGECKTTVDEAKSVVQKIDSIQENAEEYINEYFEDVRKDIELRAQVLKCRLDKYSAELFHSLKSTQLNLVKVSKEKNEITKSIDKSKSELNRAINQFENDLDYKRLDEINERILALKQSLESGARRYKESLTGNIYFIETDGNIEFQNIFGKLEIKCEKTVPESSILDLALKSRLLRLCDFSESKCWKLIYRGSRDGFDSKDFHYECDGFTNSLTVIKSSNGNVFGGFTELAWDSTGLCYKDEKAFIFSLVNRDNNAFKCMFEPTYSKSICCDAAYGPVFGSGIQISSRANIKQTSFGQVGTQYKHADYPSETAQAKTILAGSHYFQVSEIEVFRIK